MCFLAKEIEIYMDLQKSNVKFTIISECITNWNGSWTCGQTLKKAGFIHPSIK